MIRSHVSVAYNEKVWAMIDGQPEEIWFRGILPYQGYCYLPGWVADPQFHGGSVEQRTNCSAENFADSRDEMICNAIDRNEGMIEQLQDEIKRLHNLRDLPNPKIP